MVQQKKNDLYFVPIFQLRKNVINSGVSSIFLCTRDKCGRMNEITSKNFLFCILFSFFPETNHNIVIILILFLDTLKQCLPLLYMQTIKMLK